MNRVRNALDHTNLTDTSSLMSQFKRQTNDAVLTNRDNLHAVRKFAVECIDVDILGHMCGHYETMNTMRLNIAASRVAIRSTQRNREAKDCLLSFYQFSTFFTSVNQLIVEAILLN